MNEIDVWTWCIIGGVIVLALLVFGTLFFYQREQSRRLKSHFGPEYDRTVSEFKNRAKAESNLKDREKRVGSLQIVPLEASEASRFAGAWKTLQAGFVDNPKGVVVQADQLVRELMIKRGYPMGDFEHRAGDISVDHPDVVHHYRAAQVIVMRDERGETSTEDLRKAVVHFRALFQDLLEATATRRAPIQATEVAMHS